MDLGYQYTNQTFIQSPLLIRMYALGTIYMFLSLSTLQPLFLCKTPTPLLTLPPNLHTPTPYLPTYQPTHFPPLPPSPPSSPKAPRPLPHHHHHHHLAPPSPLHNTKTKTKPCIHYHDPKQHPHNQNWYLQNSIYGMIYL